MSTDQQQIKSIKSALGHSEFPDNDIYLAVIELLDAIGNDLEDVGYEASTKTELKQEELEEAVLNYEESLDEEDEDEDEEEWDIDEDEENEEEE